MAKQNKFQYTPLREPIPIREQKWPEDTLPLVHTRTMAFNHESFIRDCIEGILMQRTTFPVKVLIHDDASTDGTQGIIADYAKQYPNTIQVVLQKKNTYSQEKAVKRKLREPFWKLRKGKYEAPCEGDDYWTDPFKLQKQVDFLEKNPDYMLTSGGYKALINGKEEVRVLENMVPAAQETIKGFTYTLQDLRKGWFTKTLTLVYRNRADIYEELQKYRYGRDVHLNFHFLKEGKGYYFKEVLGMYNIHAGGIHSMKEKDQMLKMAYLCYKELYLHNGDETSRWMYRKYALALFNHRLFADEGFSFAKDFHLWTEGMKTTRQLREIKNLVFCFLPEERKNKLKGK